MFITTLHKARETQQWLLPRGKQMLPGVRRQEAVTTRYVHTLQVQTGRQQRRQPEYLHGFQHNVQCVVRWRFNLQHPQLCHAGQEVR